MPVIFGGDVTDDPPYLLGIEDGGVVVWRLLLDYRFMDSKFFHVKQTTKSNGDTQMTVAVSDEILTWMQQNDPNYQWNIFGRSTFVIRFSSDVPAMGFRLRFSARISEDTPSNRWMFGLRPQSACDAATPVG